MAKYVSSSVQAHAQCGYYSIFNENSTISIIAGLFNHQRVMQLVRFYERKWLHKCGTQQNLTLDEYDALIATFFNRGVSNINVISHT